MDNYDYETTQQQIMFLASLIVPLDLKGFLDRINQSHSFAPILDPTLYRAAAGNLSKIEDIARGLYVAQQVIKRVAGVEEGADVS